MAAFGIRDVVDTGIRVGCGVCAIAQPAITIERTDFGTFEPDVSHLGDDDLIRADAVCPFSDSTPDETQLAATLFSDEDPIQDRRIGRYSRLMSGYVTDAAAREQSSSGGLTNWMLESLLSKNT
ncbi:hypothetical protein MWN33_00005 [Starkeya koreensis]|uniref:Uncharacterized protein n=1 Tax=Ancylobacter koreensis TaxID=266121 RepID=A0ABT0DGK3_9HYPH|nr:hypothetical protein [Ancylobacter koreensis]MCK0206412.1 hypothetical protein [Ancylobacter koreensis]